MRDTQQRDLEFYSTQNGREPFYDWYRSIRDTNTKYRIQRRLERLKTGNFGDCKSVGEGVFELRIHFGPGYRVYFGEVSNKIVIVLCGGDKSSQQRDIERAITYWQEYKETQT